VWIQDLKKALIRAKMHTRDEESSMVDLQQYEGTGRSLSKRVVAALSVGASLLLAPAAFYGGVAYGSHGTTPQTAAMDMVVEKVIEAEPKMQSCASVTENCMSNKCCMTSGMKCWRISDTMAKCSKFCPGGICWVEKPAYAFKPSYMTKDNSIFCYAVHANKQGDGITGEKDVAILSAQLKNNVGLFACNDWEVFSDTPTALSPTINTRVLPTNSEYGKFFRKDKPKKYVNTPLFYEAWKLLKADGRWSAMSWVVKVDAPTVFMPENLRTLLAPKQDDSTGVYFQNCKKVLEGFFGNLEVASAEGFKRFLEQMDTAFTTGCWRQTTEECKKGWKYGPWGEDLFMQRTMDDAEVSKISDFGLTTSGTCPGDRPKASKDDSKYVPPCKAGETKAAIHPFRNVSAWFTCLGTITGKQYS